MIGFIGLGIMGSRMANNLIDAGQELIIYNRTKEKGQHLINKGAIWSNSPESVAKQSDIIITMLSTPEVVKDVALGDEGFLPHLKPGSLWVDCSTVHPSFTRTMAAEAKSRDIRFLDAPVAGSKIPAEEGELVFFVGGSDHDFHEARPFFDVMGKASNHMGENGKGTSMKVIINLMLAQSMAAFSEAVHLGEAIGLNKEVVVNTLVNGPATAPFLQGKKDKLLNEDFTVEFPLEHMHKDLHLVAQSAYENNIALPIANVTKEMYALAKQNGLANEDFSAIYRLLKQK